MLLDVLEDVILHKLQEGINFEVSDDGIVVGEILSRDLNGSPIKAFHDVVEELLLGISG